jgi:hypothetical protein
MRIERPAEQKEHAIVTLFWAFRPEDVRLDCIQPGAGRQEKRF